MIGVDRSDSCIAIGSWLCRGASTTEGSVVCHVMVVEMAVEPVTPR